MKLLVLKLGVSRAFSALVAFAGVAVIARTHPLDVVGEINASLALIQVAALCLGFGLNTAIVYFSKSDIAITRWLTMHACMLTVGLTIPAVALASMFSATYALLAACSGLVAILTHVAGFLQSNQDFDKQAVLIVMQPCAIPLANQMGLLVSNEVLWFFLAYATVNLALASAFLVLVVRPWLISEPRPGYPGKTFYAYGLAALGHNGVNAVWYSADVLLVRYGLSSDFLGIYSVAASVAKSSWLVVDSVGLIIFPRKIAGTLSRSQYGRVQMLCLVYGFGVIGAWIWLGDAFLELVFGRQYMGAFPMVLTLLAGSLAVGVYKLQSRLFAATGGWRILSMAQLCGLSTSLGAAAVLVGSNGGIGVALGQSLGFLVCAAGLCGLGYRSRFRLWER
ncbi:MAG: hypothetical protein AW08_03773 [Candidatus Accumulibacter adjunctus]|uniref:Polysaccharide biosynthesis protein n=1 Tax=Candidatus Accumulibacter adjunctus TaxID=1454001 RepID=A0A011NIL9_9PROT|nr:MAG: hypothetical protein AW08_03773 [Candidatus Accumulibacter adjunctus]